MKGMIFAAGIGSRLKPWTEKHPKALAEINGVPMLERVIKTFLDTGINDIIVNVHHFADQISSFLKLNNNFGCNIMLSDEQSQLLDTGGGLAKAAPMLYDSDSILVHNADIYTDLTLSDLVSFHKKSGADISMLTSNRKSSRKLLFNKSGQLTGWINLNTGEKLPNNLNVTEDLIEQSFNGIHMLKCPILDFLRQYSSKAPTFSIIPAYVEMCNHVDIRMYTPEYDYNWIDIGTPEKLSKACHIDRTTCHN